MIEDGKGNRWLTHPEPKGVTPPADAKTICDYRDHAKMTTGGTALPPVNYKGQTIPARHL